jgi:L-lactate dehydrogenase complex protein LldG
MMRDTMPGVAALEDHPADSAHAGSSRRAILSRLRAAMPSVPIPVPDLQPYYADDAAVSDLDADRRIARFVEHARGWRADVIETTPDGLGAAVLAVLDDKGVQRLLAGRDTPLADCLQNVIDPARLAWYDAPIEDFKATLFDDIDAGISTVRGGIVETGSLVLWPTIAEPRTLSLVPPLHIAVLRADTLHDTLHAIMQAEHWADGLPTNALLVTGPSKTADIQRLLVYGAHGPKQLVILLVREGVAA